MRPLQDGEWASLGGLPVTRPQRTAADLLRSREDPEAVAQVIADALRRGHAGQTVTLPLRDGHGVAERPASVPHTAEPGIGHARGIVRELAAAGQHVSRRALRSGGVKGSNEALNALALRLSAELAIDTVMCS